MTMRTSPEIDTLSIDDLYNNLRVFEQEIQGASKTSSSAQNVAFVSQMLKNIFKSGFTSAYSTCTPSTSSTNVPEKEVLAGFADEVIYSLFSKQTEDFDLLHEDLEQIDDVDIEEMDINWQIAMIAIRMKKFYKKTGRRVRVDGKTPVGFDKKKLECFNCHNTRQELDVVAQPIPTPTPLLIPTPTPPPIPTHTPPPIPTTSPTHIPISTPIPLPIPDNEPTPFEHIYEEPSP
ncbi:hypothetical protein Tco_0700111, partial [Tanacetum coccineum]